MNSERRELAIKILDTLCPMPVSPDNPHLTEDIRATLTRAREERLQKIEALLKKDALVWPKALIEAIEEYEQKSKIPGPQFPGHKGMWTANQVAYIGERVAGIYVAQRDGM